MRKRISSGRPGIPAAAARAGSRKIIVEFPEELLREAEEAVRELAMNRSQLIRAALELYLRRRRDERIERELAESLRANAALDRRLLKDFKHVDTEN